jgi:hypothetical protein
MEPLPARSLLTKQPAILLCRERTNGKLAVPAIFLFSNLKQDRRQRLH